MNMIFDSKRRCMIVGSIKLIIFVNVHSSPNQIIAISPLSGSTQYIFFIFVGTIRFCSVLFRIIKRLPVTLHSFTYNYKGTARENLAIYTTYAEKNEVTYHVVIVLLRSFN